MRLQTNTLLIWFFITFFGQVRAQESYPKYFENIILAGEFYTYKKDYDKAAFHYLASYNSIPDKSKFNAYQQLIFSLYKINKFDSIKYFLDEFSCKYTINTIKESFKFRDPNYLIIDELLSRYGTKCKLSNDLDFSDKIAINEDSLFSELIKIDQKGRVDSNYANVQLYNDSLVFINIKAHFEKYGVTYMPGMVTFNRGTILMHLDNLSKLSQIDSILIVGVNEGKMHPGIYANIVDRCYVASKKKPKYYWLIDFDELETGLPSKEEIKGINENRKKIGLPPYPFWSGIWF